MAGIESIVRPFARPDSLATRRIVASGEKVSVGTAIIAWGKAGSLPAAHQIDAIDPNLENFTVRVEENYTETGTRKTDVLRITQTLADGSKNAENFVDLDRPYQVSFVKLDLDSSRPNETQVWTDAFDTAQFTTMNKNNQNINTKFNLNRNLT